MAKYLSLFTVALLLSAMLSAFSLRSHRPPAETALYAISFNSTWSAETHPAADFPANAHYSRMHGGTHNGNVTFWQVGELASAGIESMAETGGYGLLKDEIEAAITAGMADQFLLGDNLGSSTGAIDFSSVTVDRNFPLLTLVTMVAPSPDWFVGVHNLSLLDEHGEWLASGSVTLYPYDAGSDNGATYGAPNDDANPKQPIANISGESPFSTAPMGTLTFLRLDAPTPEPATPTVTATPLPSNTPVGASTATPTPTATPLCPVATPQPFQVDYVSPTELLTQTLAVRIGDGDAVTVTTASRVYTATGDFEFTAPARITIDLQPNQTNAIHAAAHVRKAISVGPCQYGDYTLTQTFSIVQKMTDEHRFFMPLLIRE